MQKLQCMALLTEHRFREALKVVPDTLERVAPMWEESGERLYRDIEAVYVVYEIIRKIHLLRHDFEAELHQIVSA